MEEPTALAEGSLLTEPLPQPEQRDAESSEIEAMPKVHPFCLSWDGRLSKPFKDGDVHYSQSVLPSEVNLASPVGVFLSTYLR